TEVTGTRLPGLALPWLGWCGVALWSMALEIATRLGDRWPIRLTLAVAALVWLRLTTVERFGLGALQRGRLGTTNVIARRPAAGDVPLVCVVFHTTLETFDPRRELVPRWLSTRLIAALLVAQIFFDLTVNRTPLRLPGARLAGLSCGIVLWLTIST